MLSELIKKFADEFNELRTSTFHSDATTALLTRDLPKNLVSELKLNEDFLIKGSVGQGQWADIPWLAIMHRGVTDTTQKGYYVVLLFDRNMGKVFVSLGLGWTQFHDRFGTKIGKYKVREFSERLLKYLPKIENSISGALTMGAKTGLGKGYEASNIVAHEFVINNLDEEALVKKLGEYLKYYQLIRDGYGADIFYDVPEDDSVVDEADIKQKVKKYSVRVDKPLALKELIDAADALPPEKKKAYVSLIIRNSAFSNFVKERAKYICEICGKKPFVKKTGKLYAEADHVTPLGDKGIDHPDNMRCLCAQCHRVITYGSDEEIDNL